MACSPLGFPSSFTSPFHSDCCLRRSRHDRGQQQDVSTKKRATGNRPYPVDRDATETNSARTISRAGKKRSLKDGIFQNRWARDIVGAPTTQVLCQYLRVWGILRDVILDPLQEDRFGWRWTVDEGTPHRSRTEPSSLAHCRCWEPTNCGRPKHRRA